MLRTSSWLLSIVSLVAASSSVSIAGENATAVPVEVRAAQLKMQARVAAEQGDFGTAIKDIMEASELTGDRVTADRARQIQPTPQIGGGSPFANFGEILQLIQEQTSPPAKWLATDGEGGTVSISSQGVFVAAPAVLKALKNISDDSNLIKAAELAKSANHNTNVRQSSTLRMVSLPRLEKHVQQLAEAGKPMTDDIRTLAGLSNIEFLMVYPETGDIVIAGPAGNWSRGAEGRMVSENNGRPTLNFDDLVTLTRTFSRGGSGFFMCTIDPKQDQIVAVQEYVNKNRNTLNAKTAASFATELEQRLGLQNVFVQGVPQDSRIASVIVDADYRMKEIGIGKRKGPEGMKSYFDLLSRSEQRGSGSMDALRWWMAVGYDAVNLSSNGKVFEFAGNAVQCLAEDQTVGNDGTHNGTGKATKANAKFAELFTKHVSELAAQDVVFADMENIFDLAMVSALVHSQGLADQVGWTPAYFGNKSNLDTKSVEVPTELMTAAHHRVYSGGSVVIQVAGGVRGDMVKFVNDKNNLTTDPTLDAETSKGTPMGQQNGRWWWDAAK
ncbi:MAG: DUF1598 domain-containing protein [Fuerstiella sp.]